MYILIYKMKKRSKKYNKKTRHMQRGGCGTYWTDVSTVFSKVVPVSTNSSTTITPETKEIFVHAATNAAISAEQYSGSARNSANNVKMYTTDTAIINNASRYANNAERQSKIASIKSTSVPALSSVQNASLVLEIRTLANAASKSANAAEQYDMDAKLSYDAAEKSAIAARVSANSTLKAGITDASAKKAANNSNIAAQNAKKQALFTTETAKAARFSSNEVKHAEVNFVSNTTTPKNNLYTSATLHATLAKSREQTAAIHAGKAKEYATLAETYAIKARSAVSNSIILPLAFNSITSVKSGGSRHKTLLLSRRVITKKLNNKHLLRMY